MIRRKVLPKTTKYKADYTELLKTLDYIAGLQHGWDGDSTRAFTPVIMENIKKFLDEIVITNCCDISITPITDSTISILARHKYSPAIPLSFRISDRTFQANCMEGCEVKFTVWGNFEQASLHRLSRILRAL